MENVKKFHHSNDRFDRHSWNATLLRTQEELNHMLESVDAANKRIKCINIIGAARNLSAGSLYLQMSRSLSAAGVARDPASPLWQEKRNRTMMPCTAKICEPVVIVFEDGSTLELRPSPSGGLLMACNQIPPHMKDGLNHSSFDSEKIFAGAAGAVIEGITLTEHHGEAEYVKKTSWNIRLIGDYDLRVDHTCRGWFSFSLIQKGTDAPAMMPYEEMQRYVRGDDQIRIVEGHDNSSYFWINPVRHTAITEDNWRGVEEFREEEISVEEDDVFYYLYYFLNKYFDKEYPYGEARASYCGNEFEWSLEYNIYTYETVRTMLDEIEECANLLMTDFQNKTLDGLKNKVCNHPLDMESDPGFQQLPAEKQKREFAYRIAVAYDFYERFVTRMRNMMASASEYELISFMGP